ncbi:hypothetical protein HDV04_001857 [Boothiomyces sp. JEL0838]|nr:hypothetical protein HDV04_001857 [Boothiomyces sp. JEL0838]
MQFKSVLLGALVAATKTNFQIQANVDAGNGPYVRCLSYTGDRVVTFDFVARYQYEEAGNCMLTTFTYDSEHNTIQGVLAGAGSFDGYLTPVTSREGYAATLSLAPVPNPNVKWHVTFNENGNKGNIAVTLLNGKSVKHYNTTNFGGEFFIYVGDNLPLENIVKV